jgi:hypothetical protein
MHRFRRIYREFGTGELVRTLILLVGLLAMAVAGLLAFSSGMAALVVAAGLLLGWLLRRWIAQGVEYYRFVVPAGLAVYGVALFLGDRLGLDGHGKLLVITVTTVIVFNLKFWSLSDPGVINATASQEQQEPVEADEDAGADPPRREGPSERKPGGGGPDR